MNITDENQNYEDRLTRTAETFAALRAAMRQKLAEIEALHKPVTEPKEQDFPPPLPPKSFQESAPSPQPSENPIPKETEFNIDRACFASSIKQASHLPDHLRFDLGQEITNEVPFDRRLVNLADRISKRHEALEIHEQESPDDFLPPQETLEQEIIDPPIAQDDAHHHDTLAHPLSDIQYNVEGKLSESLAALRMGLERITSTLQPPPKATPESRPVQSAPEETPQVVEPEIIPQHTTEPQAEKPHAPRMTPEVFTEKLSQCVKDAIQSDIKSEIESEIKQSLKQEIKRELKAEIPKMTEAQNPAPPNTNREETLWMDDLGPDHFPHNPSPSFTPNNPFQSTGLGDDGLMASLYGYFTENPQEFFAMQMELSSGHHKIWQSVVHHLNGHPYAPYISPAPHDTRFQKPIWRDNWIFDFCKQSYLLHTRILKKIIENKTRTMPAHQKRHFIYRAGQIMAESSPSNHLMTH